MSEAVLAMCECDSEATPVVIAMSRCVMVVMMRVRRGDVTNACVVAIPLAAIRGGPVIAATSDDLVVYIEVAGIRDVVVNWGVLVDVTVVIVVTSRDIFVDIVAMSGMLVDIAVIIVVMSDMLVDTAVIVDDRRPARVVVVRPEVVVQRDVHPRQQLEPGQPQHAQGKSDPSPRSSPSGRARRAHRSSRAWRHRPTPECTTAGTATDRSCGSFSPDAFVVL